MRWLKTCFKIVKITLVFTLSLIRGPTAGNILLPTGCSPTVHLGNSRAPGQQEAQAELAENEFSLV